MMKHSRSLGAALAILTLAAFTAAAAPARTGCHPRDRQGLFLGVNAGVGGAAFQSKLAKQTISDDPWSGGAGGLRFGYAFNNNWAMSLETLGFGAEQDDEDWGLGAGFATVTWWPEGGGFFLRLGVGGGGGDIRRRGTDELLHFEEKAAGLFGLGYEWQVSRRFALGVAADAMGFELDGASGLEDDTAGVGTVTIQCNWYL